MWKSLVWMVIVVVQLTRRSATGYIETVTASGCESCMLYLTCRHLGAVIAILDFDFVPENLTEDALQNGTVFRNYTLDNFDAVHPRNALNHRCSGVNHCSFILTEDCPGTSRWGNGTISVTYACITEDLLGKYCNTNIQLPNKSAIFSGVSQGFLVNPGYPRFYAGEKECRWKITAPPQQKLKFTFLDVSLLVDNVGNEEECTDVLTLNDTGQVIYSTCRQEHPPFEIISGSETVEVLLTSSKRFNPARRGIFLKYTAVGCSTPTPPLGASLIFRNDDTAEFSCAENAVFPDTGETNRIIRCKGFDSWNETLPLLDCVSRDEYKPQQADIVNKILENSQASSEMAAELIVPTVIMISLFIINAAVVYFINKARKRQAILIVSDEELGTFTSNVQDKPNM